MDGNTNPGIDTSPRTVTTDVYAIPLADNYLVYAPLRKLAFLTNPALVNLLWGLRDGRVDSLESDQQDTVRFLEEIQLLGMEGDHPIATYGSHTFDPTHVTLFLTNRCNLRCTYCYASAGSHRPEDMPLELAQRSVEYVLENAIRRKSGAIGISFHGGGEPTVNWQVLVGSLDYAKRRAGENGLSVHASLATNGVLSASKRGWIIENMDALSLSWDGLPEVHDAQRPRVSGRGSSETVLGTIDALEGAGFPYGVRMTVTAGSVHRLVESVSFLLNGAKPGRVQVEPVYDLGRGKDGLQHVSPEAFVQAFNQAKAVADQHGAELFFSAARLDTLTNRFCRSCGEGFSVTPNGEVSACFEVSGRDGPIAEGFLFGSFNPGSNRFEFDAGKLEQLRDRTVEQVPWCKGCFARWHCAGDCQHKARQAMRNGEFKGHPRCEITQAILLGQILDKIKRSGGMIWKEGAADISIPVRLSAERLADIPQ